MSETTWGPGAWGVMPWGTGFEGPLDISYRTVTYGRVVSRTVALNDHRTAAYGRVIYRTCVLVDHLSRTGSP